MAKAKKTVADLTADDFTNAKIDLAITRAKQLIAQLKKMRAKKDKDWSHEGTASHIVQKLEELPNVGGN